MNLRVSRLAWLACASSVASMAVDAASPDILALQELGKQVFFDEISRPVGRQGCSSCHVPDTGWTGGLAIINRTIVAIPGADPHTIGGRKPPNIAYATHVPKFGDSPLALQTAFPGACAAGIVGVFCAGGVFWDGRATGNAIGDEVFGGNAVLKEAYESFLGPLADQALGPFPNDVEQNVPDGHDLGVPGAEAVCKAVKAAKYAPLYRKAWGTPIECAMRPDISFKRIAVAISAWEQSGEVNSFSSKRDAVIAGTARFTAQEQLGHDLFLGKAGCIACHKDTLGADDTEQTYSDGSFHNIGLPPNFAIANFDPQHPDVGLAQHIAGPGHEGAFRTPSLRNVDKRPNRAFVKAYMHNGYFKSLEDVVHFYNTATVKMDPVKCPAGTPAELARRRDCWPAPESTNAGISSPTFLGNLGLSAAEEAALVAYLKTLTDTQTVKAPRPFK